MGLTSPALSYVLAVVTAGVLLGVILAWRRLAGPGTRAIALRAVCQLAVQACALALIFVLVNGSGEFYSSWSDLLGLDHGAAQVQATAGVSTASVRPVVLTGKTSVRAAGDGAAAGVLESVRLYGELSGLSVPGAVYLPPGYPAARPPGGYPVILEISNAIDSTTSPYGSDRLAGIAAMLIAAHRMAPALVVMLPATLGPGDDGCLDVAGRPATTQLAGVAPTLAQTFFATDLPAILQSRYDASVSASRWALLADGSGGYCALHLALTTSWQFSAAVVPPGSYTAPPGGAVRSPELARQDDLIWLLHHQPMPPVSVLFVGSASDIGFGRAEPLAELARPPMRVSQTPLGTGGSPLTGVLGWIAKAIGGAPEEQ
ncbi:MAG TPA: hypothetical protein VGI58_20040 [Streptosporangiaceae bacterium]